MERRGAANRPAPERAHCTSQCNTDDGRIGERHSGNFRSLLVLVHAKLVANARSPSLRVLHLVHGSPPAVKAWEGEHDGARSAFLFGCRLRPPGRTGSGDILASLTIAAPLSVLDFIARDFDPVLSRVRCGPRLAAQKARRPPPFWALHAQHSPPRCHAPYVFS